MIRITINVIHMVTCSLNMKLSKVCSKIPNNDIKFMLDGHVIMSDGHLAFLGTKNCK